MDREEYLRRWAELHGGMEPSSNRLVAFWLTVVHALARPLVALGASPNAVTTLGLGIVLAAVGAAAAGGPWLLLAGLLVLLSGLADNLDGAVAVMTSRTSRWGYVYDSVVDRIADLLFLLALWLAGAPAWVCIVTGGLTFLQEYARARAAAAGMSEIGVVSVWERPSRVLVVGMFLFADGLYGGDVTELAVVGAAVAALLAVVGTGQVLVMIRRRLRQSAD
ncbi:MAG: CDP-alcohol phosphatidyltransferase family protein [Actinobacteria bacterium]|nr:CDP-alcohol phosphatidyltransferase family protein [Actinomycetota bacterium]MCB9412284.1 CDP-alcohol phosphatidyltransferase family protein [Actinomycetota bacterium]